MSQQLGKPIRFAVAGLGHIAKKAVLPGFAHAKDAELVALFSGNETKRNELSAQYNLASNVFDYAHLEEGLKTSHADALYIAVPNDRHCALALRAMRAGSSVLCEKPLAATVEECEEMANTAKECGVQLMAGLRMQFAPAHLAALTAAHNGELGEVRSFHSVFTVQVAAGNVRTKRDQGGGPLLDLGIYCVNASRQLFQAEPIEVIGLTATCQDDERFTEVEEMFTAFLRFPGERIATFTCSFGSTRVMTYTVVGTQAALHLDPVYDYGSDVHMQSVSASGRTERLFPKIDQFAAEIEHFAACIRTGREPGPSAADAIADLKVITALQRSAGLSHAVLVS